MSKIYYIFSLCIVLATSCEKEADNVKYPEFVPKVVVSAYISPDESQCNLEFISNLNLYGNYRFGPYKTAKITIRSDERELILNFDTIQRGYIFKTSDFPLVEGKTYTLNILLDNEKLITSSCTIPFKRNFELKIDTNMHISSYMDMDTLRTYTSVNTVLSFTDYKNENNYYGLFYEVLAYDSKYPPNIFIRNDFILPDGSQVKDNGQFFTDKDIEGKRTKIELGSASITGYDSAFLKVYFLNIDKPYYDFKKSLENYSSGENPFIEPSPVYSNISGGLGVFASYTMDSVIFRLK